MMMKFLSENEIKGIVFDYLDESVYDYAVMLDGGWGYGKTYFIKNKLIPEIEKTDIKVKNAHNQTRNKKNKCKRKVVYVSLYGLRDTNEISNQIFLRILEFSMGKNGKYLPVVGVGITALTEKFGVSSLTKGNVSEVLSGFAEFQNYVFIFDDLERCSIPINEVLGYLNNLVEQNSIKVIIIANQSEIGSLFSQENLELKYLFASQKSIDFDCDRLDKNQFVSGKPKDISPEKLDLNTLKNHVSYIFEDNELYNQIKEKLIGKTIHYHPELKEIVPLVIKKCNKENSIYDLIEPIIPQIIEILIKEDHYNIRTLQFTVLLINKILDLLKDEIISDEIRKRLFKEVLVASLKVSISFKQGKSDYKWPENTEYGKINMNVKPAIFNNYFNSFKFIHEYVYFSSFDEQRIKSILLSYCQELKLDMERSNDPIMKLPLYWTLEDTEVDTELSNLLNNFNSNKYKATDFLTILGILISLEELGFNVNNFDRVVEKMKVQVGSKGGMIHGYLKLIMRSGDPGYEKYEKYKEELFALNKDYESQTNKNGINAVFAMDEGWGRAFYEFFIANESDFHSQKEFFSLVELKVCIEKLDNASTKEFNDFFVGFDDIYKYKNPIDFFINDSININILKKHLSETKYESKTKEQNRINFVNALDSLLNEFL